ncbi:hypothetical protein HWV62_11121 [Athelia sp. TMB]|nr:hypothetical protein HWV62_11121 [Athelia sp. TMB]
MRVRFAIQRQGPQLHVAFAGKHTPAANDELVCMPVVGDEHLEPLGDIDVEIPCTTHNDLDGVPVVVELEYYWSHVTGSEASRAHGGPLSRNLGTDEHLAWDFQEFDHHVKAMARGLIAMGVKKGERVGVIMGNNRHWACASIGAILVTINPAYRLSELITTLNLVSVSHLFLVPSIRTSHYTFLLSGAFPALRDSSPGAIDEPALPALRNIVIVNHTTDREKYRKDLHGLKGTIDWREVMMWREDGREANELKEISKSLNKDDVINLQFTRCAFYPSPAFDPHLIIDAVLAEHCTALHGVPTHFLGVLGEVEKRQKLGLWDRKGLRLRTGIAAGSSVPIELMKRLGRELGLNELTNAYGMSISASCDLMKLVLNSWLVLQSRIFSDRTIRYYRTTYLYVPVGTPGEICVAGYLVQKGYWNDKEQTQSVMHEDHEGVVWMHTGDEGIMDEEGYLKNAMTRHQGILEAAAIAVPDEHYGEVVGAWIVRRDSGDVAAITKDEVRSFVSREMNPQNAPAWVWFLGEDGLPEELPKTASGKVMKHVLREWSRDLAAKDVGKVAILKTSLV